MGAHNAHVATSSHGGSEPTLGQYLRARHGHAYYALGLLFNQGAFRARRIVPDVSPGPRIGAVVANKVEPAPAGTVEAHLAAADLGDHFLDLRCTHNAPTAVRHWLQSNLDTRLFGSVVPHPIFGAGLRPTVLVDTYDGLANIAISSPSQPLEPS
ncbi:erythromycin esterase family protein [Streptomyces cinereoruber]|uniref:erythromycin esterase family protein n=1 Tax=Streptomyces cinereoruber TaxID=67260 RepID=UPI00362BC36E